MTYTIGKAFAFAASHQLKGLPDGHQCGRLHGHNYTVHVEITGDRLNDAGMVYDFGGLAPFRHYLDDEVDHRHLNDLWDANPTAETLAAKFHHVASALLGFTVSAVTVWETPTCFATYRP